MKTLFLAWQDKHRTATAHAASRAWFTIGRLEAEPVEERYRFAYTHGALAAQRQAGFQPLAAFPRFDQIYESAELFPPFQNRLVNPRREDFAEYIRRLGLDPGAPDPLEVLAITGGERQTDNLEVFPKILKRRDGSFVCKFFLHGSRHVNVTAQDRLARLRPGDRLQVALELNNPVAGPAIQLETTSDYFMVGWAPRYLVRDMLDAIAESPADLTARVVRVNPPPAPHNQRLLVELEGRFRAGFSPMESEEFRPIVA